MSEPYLEFPSYLSFFSGGYDRSPSKQPKRGFILYLGATETGILDWDRHQPNLPIRVVIWLPKYDICHLFIWFLINDNISLISVIYQFVNLQNANRLFLVWFQIYPYSKPRSNTSAMGFPTTGTKSESYSPILCHLRYQNKINLSTLRGKLWRSNQEWSNLIRLRVTICIPHLTEEGEESSTYLSE